ncbi:hypothetical protein WJX74_006842 [Apatococcus lobatus]|uniref:6-phosphogluconate dehydrogenase n=1 Tax=Apatococcus lobatus TaxID=904363 RepID=A0AAW1SAJ9_9CHLO
MPEQCGWAGLGGMGSGLAEQLRRCCAEKGLPAPLVWNRTKAKAEPLVAAGCKLASSPADLAQQCSIIFFMLASDAVAEKVFEDIASSRKERGLIVADCSTNAPPTAARLEALGQDQEPRIVYCACPVFGRPDAVRAGQLLFTVGGQSEARARVTPILEGMGRGVVDIGDAAEQAAIIKITGNYFIGNIIQMLGEGFALVEKAGLPKEVLMNIIKLMFNAPSFISYGNNMLHDIFVRTAEDPGQPLVNGTKDTEHAKALGKALGVPLPAADVILGNCKDMVERGGGDLDWSSACLPVREAAGVKSDKDLPS